MNTIEIKGSKQVLNAFIYLGIQEY